MLDGDFPDRGRTDADLVVRIISQPASFGGEIEV
jgi:hypothetical protein